MENKDKAAPQTRTQRQATLRAKRIAAGFTEVTMWIEADTCNQLKAQAIEQGITIGQRIDQLVKG